jgi:hypothetical protein
MGRLVGLGLLLWGLFLAPLIGGLSWPRRIDAPAPGVFYTGPDGKPYYLLFGSRQAPRPLLFAQASFMFTLIGFEDGWVYFYGLSAPNLSPWRLYRARWDGAEQQEVIPQTLSRFRTSPDHQTVAFITATGEAGDSAPHTLYRVQRDGQHLRPILAVPPSTDYLLALAWSPDQQQIAYASYSSSGHISLHVIPAAGGDHPSSRILSSEPTAWTSLNHMLWIGEWLILSISLFPNGSFALYRVRPDGSALTALVYADTGSGFISPAPDGTSIIYDSGQRLQYLRRVEIETGEQSLVPSQKPADLGLTWPRPARLYQISTHGPGPTYYLYENNRVIGLYPLPALETRWRPPIPLAASVFLSGGGLYLILKRRTAHERKKHPRRSVRTPRSGP